MMKTEQIRKYFIDGEGLPIISADDLVDALFDGEIKILESIPYSTEPDYLEYNELSDKVQHALETVYSKKEAIRILDRMGELRALRTECDYRFCFKEGIKIGFVMCQLTKES